MPEWGAPGSAGSKRVPCYPFESSIGHSIKAIYRIIVLGGYGHFGARICRALAQEPHVALTVAGRDGEAAARLVAELPGSKRHQPMTVDVRDPALDGRFREAEAELVIHTCGPFQGQDHDVAEACLRAGCDYIDLADGRAFVEGFPALDTRARAVGRVLITGASTVPGVSSAVVAGHAPEFERLESVRLGITPGQRTPRGTATIAAVLSYCGRPFQQWEQGRWVTRHGWHDLQQFPHPALGGRLWGACDVPDLGLFPEHWPELQSVSFHAGLELPPMQLGLWIAGWIARARLVRDWSRHAGLLKRLTDRLDRFGSGDGGMFVHMAGTGADGRPLIIEWWLTAWNGHGPYIPCVPAVILARRLAAGDRPSPGARACMALIDLAAFAEEVEHLDIEWATRRNPP